MGPDSDVVALHVTVVKCPCDANGGPDLLLWVRAPTLLRGHSWTPQHHSAPLGPVLPEAQLAKATSASTRVRPSGCCVRSATKRSAPRQARHGTACALPRRLSLWWHHGALLECTRTVVVARAPTSLDATPAARVSLMCIPTSRGALVLVTTVKGGGTL